jgi:hypothetical protein
VSTEIPLDAVGGDATLIEADPLEAPTLGFSMEIALRVGTERRLEASARAGHGSEQRMTHAKHNLESTTNGLVYYHSPLDREAALGQDHPPRNLRMGTSPATRQRQ